MEFIDLATQQRRIRDKIDRNIQKVLADNQYIMGPEVRDLEAKLAEYVGIKHAIGCASGTDALLMALMAYRVGQGNLIFTAPFTFIATAEVISLVGGTPVFVDIEPNTFNLDPEQLKKAITAVKTVDQRLYPLPKPFLENPEVFKPSGILPVDLFGLTADYDQINRIAKEHNLFVIEDAAQSFGAEYRGMKACSLAEIACTSFFPAKPLGCYGDGGMCFTEDDEKAEIMGSIRSHGKGGHKYENVRIGINGRLDTLQAAILLAKFDIFPEEIELRQEVARRYTNFLSSKNDELQTPYVPPGYRSAWAQYSVLARDQEHRAILQNKLKHSGIPAAIYYPKPLHLQMAFTYLGYKKGDFPISEDCANRIFSLPMHPYLSEEDQSEISKILCQE